MKELKIGDKVRIRKDLKAGKKYGGILFVPHMLKYCGKKATIKNQPCFDGGFCLNEFSYFWSPEMFVSKEKLIFRDNATILIKDGKKYVTKCDKNDTYDREKGLLVVLAKANGYNYNDIQEMLKNAEIQGKNKQVTEVKRVAKVGEYIKVVNAKENGNKHGDGFAYKNGDILRVINIGLLTKTCTLKNKGSNFTFSEDYNLLFPSEYVVLENYQQSK